ncbi:hypothetical protein GCM10022281_22060 [Sphingomonas rosea]|uniref:TonB C-terminal domain-containing protein n=1 Tax=Sphingomonas rosea TaxID=335605 RepID=A0ABP7UCV2_9SPHN
MARRKSPDPVQPGGSGKQTILAVLLAAILAVAFWGWQQEEDVPDAPPLPRETEERPSPPPPPPPPPTGVSANPVSPGRGLATPARANLAALFSDEDYPADAIRRNEQGTTRFEVAVDPQGRVARCTILSSSGSAALDAATCRVIRTRARFIPATDSDGRPTSDAIRLLIRWVLP